MKPAIPIVNCEGDVEKVSEEIFKAIQEVGFVYLRDFGVDKDEVAMAFLSADQFWALDPEDKAKYARPKAGLNGGYVAAGTEILDTEGAREIREAFNITPDEGSAMLLPVDEIPSFEPTQLHFFKALSGVAVKLLRGLGKELLGKEKADFFVGAHAELGREGGGNPSSLRLLRYPPVEASVADGATRCGTHTDYGTLTLLFQDAVGGLEVRSKTGAWVRATPVEGAVLLNAGDLLERWSGGRIPAVPHRVLIPSDETLREVPRRSIVLFLHPDHPCEVSPVVGTEAGDAKPLIAKDHLEKRFKDTYVS